MKCLLLCAFAAVLAWSASAQPVELNGVAARVNEAVITKKDVETRIAADLPFLAQQYRTPQALNQKVTELRQTHLEALIEEQLILHEFKTAGYNLPESYIDDQVNKAIREVGGRATLTKTLQAQNRTYESFRKEIRDKTVLREMRRQNVPFDPVISPHKIETYYLEHRDQFKVEDQIKLRMIVVTNRPSAAGFSAKKLADEIIKKIEEGVPFAEMAKIYSQGSQSGEGGDWGWVERSVLRTDLAEKAFALKAGQRSSVIEAQDGCYIMLVEGVQPAHAKSLAEVREEIESTLKDEEVRRLRKKWIDQLKNKSFVRYF
jgi:peptidyl-prolyl cis-trans isomerase SurA